MIYDLLSGTGIILAIVGAARMIVLASRHRKARVPFLLIAIFCLLAAVFYAVILIAVPILGLLTAAVSRSIVILLLSGIIMESYIIEK